MWKNQARLFSYFWLNPNKFQWILEQKERERERECKAREEQTNCGSPNRGDTKMCLLLLKTFNGNNTQT